MLSQPITIINQLGLHARASAKWVTVAGQFKSHIELCKGTQRINAKSIMGVMLLAASQGTELTLIIDGEDEQEAFKALHELVQQRFGEAE